MTIVTTGYSFLAAMGDRRNLDGAPQDDKAFRQALAGPGVSGLPVEPTPEVSGLPYEPAPRVSGLPYEPTPEVSGLPVQPAPEVSGLPYEPAPEVSGLPVEPSPKDYGGIDPLILLTHRLSVELATRFFDLKQSASEGSGAASES